MKAQTPSDMAWAVLKAMSAPAPLQFTRLYGEPVVGVPIRIDEDKGRKRELKGAGTHLLVVLRDREDPIPLWECTRVRP